MSRLRLEPYEPGAGLRERALQAADTLAREWRGADFTPPKSDLPIMLSKRRRQNPTDADRAANDREWERKAAYLRKLRKFRYGI